MSFATWGSPVKFIPDVAYDKPGHAILRKGEEVELTPAQKNNPAFLTLNQPGPVSGVSREPFSGEMPPLNKPPPAKSALKPSRLRPPPKAAAPPARRARSRR